VSAYTEQEELEKLKSWWKTYGGSLVAGVALGLAILFGYRYWVDYRQTQREAASVLYDQLLDEVRARKPEASASGTKLIEEYASTPYASMAALLLARQAYESGDKAGARQRLEWVVANAEDSSTQHAARLRLARLLIEAGEIAQAATLAETKDTAGFESEYLELRGDLAVAQGKPEQAREAYRGALKQLPSGSQYRTALSMKLDDLGAEKAQ
jgi:predicted negative regulator of RcsB-dependent stress response